MARGTMRKKADAALLRFADRAEAGRLLAANLETYASGTGVLVLALPRGGVSVAYEVAERLKAPLDVLVAVKLGIPGQPEAAMGAVASGGLTLLDRPLIHSLGLSGAQVAGVIAKGTVEIARRETVFRNAYPEPQLAGRTVILVDDGAATGSTMIAAARAVRQRSPRELIIAIPVASREAVHAFRTEADACMCLEAPRFFQSVGEWYSSFPQVADKEVIALLERSRSHQGEQ